MRLSHWVLIASLGLAAAALPARAFTIGADALPARGPANIIEAAVHCGPHAHYIRGHRDRNGHYIKGRCVHDKRPPRPMPPPPRR